MSGILIAEPRVVCNDPSKDNCATRTFILKDMNPEQDGAFRAFMGGDIRNFEEATDRNVIEQIVTKRCKMLPNGETLIGNRVACCPDSYRDDYKELMFDENGNMIDNSDVQVRTMNLGKYDAGAQTYRLCPQNVIDKCDVTQTELEKMGFSTKEACIKKHCNNDKYTRSLDKRELCLVGNDTPNNPAGNCPLECEYRELIQEDANYKAAVGGIIALAVLLIIAVIIVVYMLVKRT